mmetsp:Transcript_10032/g.29975  ORF Transcript_10032/g.29975 Transcript_10032/m.29975 type:complete len:86 (-) Transcript_10032:237-494(-)
MRCAAAATAVGAVWARGSGGPGGHFGGLTLAGGGCSLWACLDDTRSCRVPDIDCASDQRLADSGAKCLFCCRAVPEFRRGVSALL